MSSKDAVKFLQSVQPEGGWVLTAMQPDGDPDPKRPGKRVKPKTWNVQVTTPDAAQKFIDHHTQLKRNLYFTPCIPREGVEVTNWSRFKKTDIESGHLAFADHDGTYKKGADHNEVVELLRERGASYIVFTGGGYQAYWPLTESVPADYIERMNLALIEDIPGVDKTVFTPEHLMRVPGVINYPNLKKQALDRTPVMAEVVYAEPKPVEPFEMRLAAPRPPKEEHELELGDIPEDVDLDSLKLRSELRSLIENGYDEERSQGDDKSDYTFMAAAQMIRASVPDEYIVAILQDSRFGISEYCLSRDDSQRQAERSVKNAYEAGAKPPSQEFDDEPLDWEPSPEDVTEAKESKAEESKKRRVRFKRMTVDDLEALEPPEWMVENWIEELGLIQCIGVRKKGKTFVVTDMALHVALGIPWRGHAVKRKRVTYVIAEGSTARFYERIKAWLKLNGRSYEELRGWFDVVDKRVPVDNPEELHDFIAADMSAVGLVIFDTVARNMDGDENQTPDMNAFVKGADRVREIYGCAVLVVHHIGKDESRGGRGSTSLPGAVDATIQVGLKGRMVEVKMEEARNRPDGETLYYDFVNVPIADKYGVIMDGTTIKPVEMSEDEARTQTDAPENRMLVILHNRGAVNAYADLVDPNRQGLSKGSVERTMRSLRKKRLISNSAPYQLTPSGERKVAELMGEDPEVAPQPSL